MIVAASAQAAEPPENLPSWLSTSGTTKGTLPSGLWSAATSASHFVKKPATSMLKAAVREKTCASPVQPSRSSRCGQSVGTSRKLPFCPQLDVVLELVQERARGRRSAPVTGMSEWTTTPVRLSRVGSPGQPSTAT